MKKQLALFLIASLFMCACGPKASVSDESVPVTGQQEVTAKAKKTPKMKMSLMPQASGNPYELLVVMGNDQWERPVGRALFEVLDTDLPGVAQSERQFRISRIDPQSYDTKYKIFRNILLIDIQAGVYTAPKMKFSRDLYAKNQMIMTLQAPDEASLAAMLGTNGQQLLDFFNKSEINRLVKFLETNHNPVVAEKVHSQFGCEVWVPADLNKYKVGKDFFWCSNNTGSKDKSIVIYTYPYTSDKTFTLDYYVHKRDSVMKANIPGGPEGSYMMTQDGLCYVEDATVKGEYAQVARGLWRIQGDHMGGPFVAHSRVDIPNNRVVVIEGFVYAPESLKRNLIRLLEATLYTLQLPTEHNVENFTYGLEEIAITPGEE